MSFIEANVIFSSAYFFNFKITNSNYDLPTRSIDNYTHRIGRTGRAGKEGNATSFITDEDEGIMAQLKAYLETTGSEVPSRLARHPAASSAATRHGNVMF